MSRCYDVWRFHPHVVAHAISPFFFSFFFINLPFFLTSSYIFVITKQKISGQRREDIKRVIELEPLKIIQRSKNEKRSIEKNDLDKPGRLSLEQFAHVLQIIAQECFEDPWFRKILMYQNSIPELEMTKILESRKSNLLDIKNIMKIAKPLFDIVDRDGSNLIAQDQANLIFVPLVYLKLYLTKRLDITKYAPGAEEKEKSGNEEEDAMKKYFDPQYIISFMFLFFEQDKEISKHDAVNALSSFLAGIFSTASVGTDFIVPLGEEILSLDSIMESILT